MYLLKKIFQFREHANPDHEKPFLEHLEDLRITISRIVLTLLISTIVCFVARHQLMDILQRPVEQVWESGQSKNLPDKKELARPLDLDTWENSKQVATAIAPLPPPERDAFFEQSGDPDLRFHVESLLLYRAALQVPEDNRDAFLGSLDSASPELRQQVSALLAAGPNPVIDKREDLRMMGAFNPTEAFMLSIKLAFFAGIVVSFPLLLLYILQFVLPGLHKNEKSALWPAMAIGFGLFLTGVFFAYFIVLPRVLEFFHNYASDMGIANEWRIGYYISFATQFTLIFGLSFELPVVVMTLVKIGILGWESMRNTRSYAILAIFVIAAIITPTPDAFTLLLLAGPMVVLYEICIWLAYWMHRKEQQQEAEEQERDLERLRDSGEDDHPPSDDDPPETDDTEPESGEEEDTGDPYHDGYYDPSGDDPSGDDPSGDDDPGTDPDNQDIDPFNEYEDPWDQPEEPEEPSKESGSDDTDSPDKDKRDD